MTYRRSIFRFVLLLLAASSIHCSSRSDLSPLRDTDAGLIRVSWGDPFDTVRSHFEDLPGVLYFNDSVIVIPDEPLYITADSVVPPRLGELTYRRANFRGGRFFGFRVEEWYAWFSDDEGLRNIDVVFSPEELPAEELYDVVSDQLMTMYGVPEEQSPFLRTFSSRNWVDRYDVGEQPGTGILLTWIRIPGRLTLGFHEKAYADSLASVSFQDPITLQEWKRRTDGRPDR